MVEDIMIIMDWVFLDKECGFGNYDVEIDEVVKKYFVMVSNGDVWSVLNVLELVVIFFELNEDGVIYIMFDVVEECL